MSSPITPFFWFDTQAEEAAAFYVDLFEDSRIVNVARYAPNTPGEEGTVMTVDFELRGTCFTALNGGPLFQHTPRPRSSCGARRRPTSTGSGPRSSRAARPASAAGSPTGSASPGRSSRSGSTSGSAVRTRPVATARCRRCSGW